MTPEARVRSAAEELARDVLPAWLARVESSAATLRNLAHSFESVPVTDPAASDWTPWLRAEGALHGVANTEDVGELRAFHDASDDFGWFLGVLAAASGSDLFLARRDALGLRRVGAVVDVAVGERHMRAGLTPSPERLPRFTDPESASWQVPFLMALVFVRTARGMRSSEGPLQWLVDAPPESQRSAILVRQGANRVSLDDVRHVAENLARNIDVTRRRHAGREYLGLDLPAAWLTSR